MIVINLEQVKTPGISTIQPQKLKRQSIIRADRKQKPHIRDEAKPNVLRELTGP